MLRAIAVALGYGALVGVMVGLLNVFVGGAGIDPLSAALFVASGVILGGLEARLE